jgi:predicted dehydrogenase
MGERIRWGILGCGNIANKFASDLRLVNDATLSAVASRDLAKAKDFAAMYQAPLAFGSYEELVESPDVDVIYVATPHGLHHEHVMLCLRHKKAVLCEKAFALTLSQAKEMIDTAVASKVFIMEAFWTKFLPQYEKVTSLIASGEIGEIKMIQADFGFKAPEPLSKRLYEPSLGGGALLDIGIYPVFLAVSLLGRPSEMSASVKRFSTGVDQQIAGALKFDGGALATFSASFEAVSPVEATIIGTEGVIRMTNRFHNPTGNVALIKNWQPVEIGDVHREDGNGYQFEARHVTECLQKQLIESPVLTHADTLLLMETLDRIRSTCGIHYAADEIK